MIRHRCSLGVFLSVVLSLVAASSVLAAGGPTGGAKKSGISDQGSGIENTAQVRKDGDAAKAGEKDAGATSASASAPSASAAQADDDDGTLNLAQPDFTVITMPTTLRLPRFKGTFRVTHRFGRPLGAGDFGDLVGDLFGLDSGALIGLEYRFGLMRGAQVGIYRTSNKTIQFFTEYNLVKRGAERPVGLSIHASIEGTNNFKDSYSPALGLILSREIGDRAALYAQSIWVNNSNPLPRLLTDADNDTFMIGLGARVQFGSGVYLVGEWVPRIAGFHPGVDHGSFAIEKRAGGHVFQLNFSNDTGTTVAQVARGGGSNDDWYLGFAISRKFF